MIFFSFTRIVARISLIPVIVVGFLCYEGAKHSNAIIHGLFELLITLAIWCGISFGLVGGIVLSVFLLTRNRKLRVINRTARAVPNKEDMPIISYTLYPEVKHAIENQTTINGMPIEEYTRRYN